MSRKPGPKMPVGTKVGRWTVKEQAVKYTDKVECQCECGGVHLVFYSSLSVGQSTQCKTCHTTQTEKPEIGTRFGSWVMLEKPRLTKDKILCRCDCGNERRVEYMRLASGRSSKCKSCASSQNNKKHGDSSVGRDNLRNLYAVWSSVKARCDNKKHKAFGRYGGRGIKICDQWATSYESFRDWSLRSGYESGLSLDRYPDNDGNYEPSNCRWTTMKEQARNTSANHLITAFGETKPVSAWAEDARCSLKEITLRKRLKAGWSPESAITKPVNSRKDSGDDSKVRS